MTELTPDLVASISYSIQQLKDRTDIQDFFHRYTRAVGRHDRELML